MAFFTPSKPLDFKDSEFLLIYKDKPRFFNTLLNYTLRLTPIAITAYLIK